MLARAGFASMTTCQCIRYFLAEIRDVEPSVFVDASSYHPWSEQMLSRHVVLLP
jgi:hypothetical protein